MLVLLYSCLISLSFSLSLFFRVFLRCIIHDSFHFASMDVRPFYASMQYLLQSMAYCLFACLLAGWLALMLWLLFCRCVFSYSVFIRHDIYKFHICGHIFIHAYVIKSHRICAESLRKYPNTTHKHIYTYNNTISYKCLHTNYTPRALSLTYRNYFSNINIHTYTHTAYNKCGFLRYVIVFYCR